MVSLVDQVKIRRTKSFKAYHFLWNAALGSLQKILQVDLTDPQSGYNLREVSIFGAHFLAQGYHHGPQIVWDIWRAVFEEDLVMLEMIEKRRHIISRINRHLAKKQRSKRT